MAVTDQLVTKIKRSCPSIIFYKVNDKLNNINGIAMLNATYGEALAALKRSGNSVRLTVQRKSVPGRSNAHVLKSKNSDGRRRNHSSERCRAIPSAHWKKSDGHRKTSSVSDAKIVNVPVVHMSVKAKDSEKQEISSTHEFLNPLFSLNQKEWFWKNDSMKVMVLSLVLDL